MEFRLLTTETEGLWDAFCLQESGAWFWQTTAFLKYQGAYRPEQQTIPKHLMLFRERKLIALCPLALETTHMGGKAFKTYSLGGDLLPSPVISDEIHSSDRERIERTIFEEIDRLAAIDGVVKVSFRTSVLTPRFLKPAVAPVNEFIRYGYMDASVQTQIVNLEQPVEALWAMTRKSYHSLIRKTQAQWQFKLLDQASIDIKSFNFYQELHHKAAGRVTRPQITFDMMLNWISNGHAFLALASLNNKVGGCVLTVVYKNRAYYGSGCNDPEMEKAWPLGHFLHWEFMRAAQARGLTHYELGWQVFGPQWAYIPTPEEKQISFFKRGFGGFTAPLFRSEKYFTEDLFRQTYSQRLDALVEARAAPLNAES